MIEDFVLSWPLFQDTYLSGWMIAALLALTGVWVVARNQIFVSAAVAQSSTLGIALGLWSGGLLGTLLPAWLAGDTYLSALAVGFAIAGALVTHRESRPGTESPESVTGWVFLTATATSVLLLAHSPHGTEEIHRLLASTLIGATRGDVWLFTILLLVTGPTTVLLRRRLLLLAMDPVMATAVGIPVHRYGITIAIWLGLVSGLSMRVSGLVYTFGCLVLPALIARNLSREVRGMLVLAPLIALALSALGFVLANHYDYPPAQMTVFLMCLSLALAWLYRTLRPRA